ncbi:MAG: LemA family protein [Bacteroidia bacterium]|nr:LemA family protein [Bacteroidia bacterium]MCZ2277720.1 LemA family protein [Bacteroidia bacterium]
MKKWITVGILVLLAFSLYLFIKNAYNKIVTLDEGVKKAWSDVETQYQRRLDLIDNLVNTVKGYANFEQTTLTNVVEARAKATQVTVDPTNLTPEKLQEFQAAQSQMSSALGRLLAVAENYPDLKANQNFLELQAQLEGTENRIAKARTDFNTASQNYNTNIRHFPVNLLASVFGFQSKSYFKADDAAATAPKVQF